MTGPGHFGGPGQSRKTRRSMNDDPKDRLDEQSLVFASFPRLNLDPPK